jgi:AraC-like DNA-binding protein
MRSFPPSPPLASVVRAFMVVEVRDEVTRVRLPEPGLVVGVRYRGAAGIVAGEARVWTRLPDVSLTGMTTTARRMTTRANSGVVLALFHPAGAAQVLSLPMHELFGATVALADLLPPGEAERLQTQVAAAATDRDRVAAFDAFLVARLRPQPPDALVAAAVRAIDDAGGGLPIRALARRLGVSLDPFEKRFRRSVGASPKQFASLLRLRRAIDAYRPGLPLARVAQEAGYFDQSHFIRAVRAATGEPPGRFLRAGAYR